MTLFTKLFLVLFIGYIGVILYANRTLYTSTFDAVYWKDKYEHSQWKLPLSVRTLGDDGLYLYEGYRIVHGEDPTLLNAEVPPLGKYLIGLTLLSFGNGYWYGFTTTIFAVAACFLLARLLLRTSGMAVAVAVLFAMDPLVTSQFTLTMLDSLQMALGILTLYVLTFIVRHPKRRTLISLILLGVFFGLFAATKAPIFSPIMGILIGAFLIASLSSQLN